MVLTGQHLFHQLGVDVISCSKTDFSDLSASPSHSSSGHWMQEWIQSSSSDLQKSLKFFPNLISQLFIAVHEVNYPSCFTVYYEIKERRKYSVDHTTNPAPPERIGRVSVRAVSSFADTSESNTKKIRRHDRTKSLPRGWGLDLHGSSHESLKTHFDWSESLALSCELLKLGYDWLFRSQTTVQTTDNHI